jgi:hypothetical protein
MLAPMANLRGFDDDPADEVLKELLIMQALVEKANRLFKWMWTLAPRIFRKHLIFARFFPSCHAYLRGREPTVAKRANKLVLGARVWSLGCEVSASSSGLGAAANLKGSDDDPADEVLKELLIMQALVEKANRCNLPPIKLLCQFKRHSFKLL